MADEDPQPGEETAAAGGAQETDTDETELASLVVDDGKGGKLVPLSALVGAKKAARTAEKRIKELEPLAGQQESLRQRLDQAQPFIDAMANDPKLRAAAIARTRPSGEYTEQPGDDRDAQRWATDNDLWTASADGKSVLDVARARRQLDFMDERSQRQTREMVRPYAELTVGQRAESNIAAALNEMDANGVPLATAESIRETADMLGAQGRHLLANPQVVELILNNAIGLDRRRGRTPQAALDEPLYMASTGGRGAREPAISREEKARAERLGLTEKDLARAASKLATGKPSVAGRE